MRKEGDNIRSNMSPPCTILLRINGGFERISDATVIENGDHLHYEKPVGSVIVLEEASHKVLYIMNKDEICSSSLSTDESNTSQLNNYYNGDVNLSELVSQQALCTCNKANCTNYQKDCDQKQSTLKIENRSVSNLQNETNVRLIDDPHASNSKGECSNNVQNLVSDDKNHILRNREKSRTKSILLSNSFDKGTNEKTDNVQEALNDDQHLPMDTNSSHSNEKVGNLASKHSTKPKCVFYEDENQVTNKLSTMVAEVYTNEDKNENKKQSSEDEKGSQQGPMNGEPFLNNKTNGYHNKTIIDNQSRIESNKRLMKEPLSALNNFRSIDNNEKQDNEMFQGENRAQSEERNIATVDSKEISNSGKLKMPSTMSMASLTSSLDLGSNWTRPLRRRSTMSTIISTTSCSTNTANANAASCLNKLQTGNKMSSSLFRNCRLSSKNANHANLEPGERCIDKRKPDAMISNEIEIKAGHQDKVQFRAHKGAPSELDIEEKILQRREMAHLFKWYYPEGGWGWIVLCAAMLSQAICHGGLQLGFSYPLGVIIRKSFGAIQQQNQREEMLYSIDKNVSPINELIESNDHEAFHSTNTTNNLVKGVTTSSEDNLSQLQIGKKIRLLLVAYLYKYFEPSL